MSELQLSVAGCTFVVWPAEELSREERESLKRLSGPTTNDRAFRIRLNDAPRPLMNNAPRDGEPAAITADETSVCVAHARFAAIIDPLACEATLHRDDASTSFAIEVTLRTALGCRLPFEDGLLLHTAGAVVDGDAYLFYGVSGAGKSTLAGYLKNVLSDELVAVQRRQARATGFWGTLDSRDAPAGMYPLRAAIALGRGEGVSLQPITAPDARKRLLTVAVVPPHAELWTRAIKVVDELAHLPAFELTWTPSEENANRLLESVARWKRARRPTASS